MRTLRRYWLATTLAAAAAGPAVGQTAGSTLGGNIGTTATPTFSGTTGTSGATGTNANTGQTGQQSTSAAPTLSTLTTTPPILRPSQTQTGTINQVINQSNPFGPYYGNPLYQGTRLVPLSQAAGGFGNMLYTVPGVTAVSTSAGAGGRGGSALGGRGGATGTLGGTGSAAHDPGGQIVGLPRQISYTTSLRFQAPAPPPAQLVGDIRGMIDRSAAVANPAGVQVLLDAPTGVVVLRGAVRNDDEARAVEGVIRLTPGVRGVKNELQFPTP